ncbi:hypothetical protein M758_4G179900 [Ceratodon purpureus]|nr:hypothetical protein M758_4G179900 [Ceratodon purpureus]
MLKSLESSSLDNVSQLPLDILISLWLPSLTKRHKLACTRRINLERVPSKICWRPSTITCCRIIG